jgi:N-acetylmuramoyl-L-alanine amidase
MKCPFAKWLPVQNHGGPMMNHYGLVLHVQVGNGSLAGYFNNPASQVSAHFWASKIGELEQYVDTDQVAWAESAGNPNYLSVETEGYPNEPMTSDQILIVADLLVWCAKEYNFPIVGPVAHGAKGFTQHCNLDGTPDPAWGNHTCPEAIRMRQMPTIISLATPPEPVTIPKGETTHMEVITINGAEYLVSNIVANGHLVQVRQVLTSVGGASTTQNTSIIDLTDAWPTELSDVTGA